MFKKQLLSTVECRFLEPPKESKNESWFEKWNFEMSDVKLLDCEANPGLRNQEAWEIEGSKNWNSKDTEQSFIQIVQIFCRILCKTNNELVN